MAQSAVEEIEAKYRITNKRLASRLRTRKTLGNRYQLGPSIQSKVTDVYMDTKDARLLRLGYTLRLRQKNDKQLVTLKSLHNDSPIVDNGETAIHQRYDLIFAQREGNSIR
ncbi:CYTH domain-containing protein [Chloroflexi bacterium TSY]|nr:CYTH domain-containing protein [Chloroflexi bacterium TSY]